MESFQQFADTVLSRPEATPIERDYFKTARSAYIVPISTGLFDPEVDAVLNVSSDSLGFFDQSRCALVDEFVTQAALTITKDWLQRKREDIHSDYSQISRMLSEITNRLGDTDVLAGIYEVVTKRISEIVNPEVISIFLYNKTTGLLENVAERGSKPMVGVKEVYRPGQSLTGAVFESEEPILLPHPGDAGLVKPLKDPRYDHSGKEGYINIIPSGELEHYLGVPIKLGGKKLGVLRAMNKKSQYYEETAARHNRLCLLERGFSKDCRNVLEITASHLAVAIRNAELIEEKARQFEHLSFLVSSVAHEINNTSGVIPANVAGIKAQLEAPNGPIGRMLDLIEDSARQATDFANELAGFSANRAGGKKRVNINEVVSNAVEGIDLAKYGVPESISLKVSLSPRPIVCDAYERPLAQIVRNILINAFQALDTKLGGEVRVSSSTSVGETPGMALLRFKDNGPGIKLEHRARIFDGDFTTKAKGNGLGLWLARWQLQVIGGTIELASEPGDGACFIVRIPLAPNSGELPNET